MIKMIDYNNDDPLYIDAAAVVALRGVGTAPDATSVYLSSGEAFLVKGPLDAVRRRIEDDLQHSPV